MRLGKRERLTLRDKQAVAMAVQARIKRVGKHIAQLYRTHDGLIVKGTLSSSNKLLPVGKPSFKWGWDAYKSLSVRRSTPAK